MNPTLLYNDECAVCRAIASWVKSSARTVPDAERLAVRPIGDDPAALRALDPALDIWDAYATIHLLMPDGSTKCGGEAVAEVFRSLPNTRRFTPSLGWSVLGIRPFQAILNAGYTLLSDVRPLLGCESCGTPNAWVKAVRDPLERAMVAIGRARKSKRTPHFTPSTPRSSG